MYFIQEPHDVLYKIMVLYVVSFSVTLLPNKLCRIHSKRNRLLVILPHKLYLIKFQHNRIPAQNWEQQRNDAKQALSFLVLVGSDGQRPLLLSREGSKRLGWRLGWNRLALLHGLILSWCSIVYFLVMVDEILLQMKRNGNGFWN